MKRNKHISIISLVLVISMLFTLVACSSRSDENPTRSTYSPNPEIVTENTIVENIITENIIEEDIIYEHITEENYLTEVVIVENQITEMLLEEDIIEEVYDVTSIYVSEDHIDDFAEHSQTSQLFGEGLDISSILTRVAVGTGVIVTIVVLKKVGMPGPIASVVVGAADKALEFGATGAAIGAVYGGVSGATDEIDESGRMTAVWAFAAATVGLIVSVVSLVAMIPSGGTSSVTLGVGIKLAIAGIGTAVALGETVSSGVDLIQTLQVTDGTDVDWDNIDWEQVGVNATEQAIDSASSGYMMGAIIGAVYGGAEGYDFYNTYSTPYSRYNERLMRTPVDGNRGHWTGERGESTFVLDEPIELPNGRVVSEVIYHNAVPDFEPFQVERVQINNMTNNRRLNFQQADENLASYWNRIMYENRTWTARDVQLYRQTNNLTWHEMNNMHSMQLIPTEVNASFNHLGGVGEYNIMIGQEPSLIPEGGDVALYDVIVSVDDEGETDD